jgi:hypothetical protein
VGGKNRDLPVERLRELVAFVPRSPKDPVLFDGLGGRESTARPARCQQRGTGERRRGDRRNPGWGSRSRRWSPDQSLGPVSLLRAQ